MTGKGPCEHEQDEDEKVNSFFFKNLDKFNEMIQKMRGIGDFYRFLFGHETEV